MSKYPVIKEVLRTSAHYEDRRKIEGKKVKKIFSLRKFDGPALSYKDAYFVRCELFVRRADRTYSIFGVRFDDPSKAEVLYEELKKKEKKDETRQA